MTQRDDEPTRSGSPSAAAESCACPLEASAEVRVRRSDDGPLKSDRVVAEEPLEIRLNGRPLAVTLRTPGHDVELALGFLVAEQIAVRRSDVVAWAQLDTRRFEVELSSEALDRWARRRVEREFRITSACGACGRPRLEDLERELVPVESASPDRSLVYSLPERLRAGQSLFDETGGCHAAGLFSFEGEQIYVFEDIGRHNAVDKIVGACFRDGRLPLIRTVLMVSGRAGFELAEKAAIAGVSALAAVGAASSLAVSIAERTGLELYAFVRSDGATKIETASQAAES